MESAGYAGGGYSTYERSKLASRGISSLAGLAALVGATYSALAQDAQPIAYKDTNLATYGVPNFEGQTPYRTKFLDLSGKIPGKETRIDAFRDGKGFVATYSVNETVYAILIDKDGKRPVDQMYVDQTGSGKFEPYSIKAKFSTPNWVAKQ